MRHTVSAFVILCSLSICSCRREERILRNPPSGSATLNAVQVSGRIFNAEVFVLARPAFR